MKVNNNQLQVIKSIKQIVSYWETTNDLSSPTHGSDQTDVFMRLANDIEFDADKVDDLLWKIFNEIRDIK